MIALIAIDAAKAQVKFAAVCYHDSQAGGSKQKAFRRGSAGKV